jgi:NAD-dependent deacetylase
MKSAEPTLAHRLIAQTPDAFVITQNIDGLHRRAGSENVMEFHGNMEPRCLRCKTNFKLEDAYGYIDFVPVCPNCDSIKVRPRVVLFGEMPSKRDYSKALAEFAASDYVVVVGSSLIVTPAAGLIMDILGTNTKVINVNPGKVAMSGWFHKNFTMGADEGTRAALEYIASA